MSDYLLFLRNLVNHMDRAMADEGVDPDVRDRVVRRLLTGTPVPEDETAARVEPSMNTGGL